MGYTLETFAAAAHDILTAEPGPTGRQKVRALVQGVQVSAPFGKVQGALDVLSVVGVG